MLDALARFIDRRRRRVLAATVVLVAVAGVFGGPVVGLLDTDDDFEDPASEAVAAREAIVRATGESAVPDRVALVRLGAPVDSPAGAGQAAARRRGDARPRRGRGDRPRAADGPPELVSRDGRSTYVLATVPRRRRRGRGGRAPRGAAGTASRAWPLGGGVVAFDAGRRAGAGGPRARRDARLPDPLPALAARLPQRRGGAAAARRRAWPRS